MRRTLLFRWVPVAIAGCLSLLLSGCLLGPDDSEPLESEGMVEVPNEPSPAAYGFNQLPVEPYAQEQQPGQDPGKADSAYDRRSEVPQQDYSSNSHEPGGVPSAESCDTDADKIPDSKCKDGSGEGVGHGSPQPLDPTDPASDSDSDDEDSDEE